MEVPQPFHNGTPYTTSSFPSSPLEEVSLLEVASVLQNGMPAYFDEVNIDVSSCPCLTRVPFNLAGIGLNGDPTLLTVGSENTFILNPHLVPTWNPHAYSSSICNDFFIIGSGYAVKPHMPYNGHLVMNVTYRAPANWTNMSRIIFEDANRERKIEMLTEPNQTKCSFSGNFFISEGKQGYVIRVRAKGRRTEFDIITVMQTVLYEHFGDQSRRVALGGVLLIKHGIVLHHLHPEEHPPILSFTNLVESYQPHYISPKPDLIAVGTLISTQPETFTFSRPELLTRRKLYQFNSFSDYEAGGQFINDITAERTEYEGYFNVAKRLVKIG